jgi:hypothetical protein
MGMLHGASMTTPLNLILPEPWSSAKAEPETMAAIATALIVKASLIPLYFASILKINIQIMNSIEKGYFHVSFFN